MVLGESLQIVMHKLMQKNLIKLKKHPNYEVLSFKTPWYNKKDMKIIQDQRTHQKKLHDRLNYLIWDLIEKGEVDIEQHLGNKDLPINWNPITNHLKRNDKGKDREYHNANYTYVVSSMDSLKS